MKKICVGIVFGGKSAEHEISILSAKNIVDALDKNKYNVVLIGIDKKGRWYLNEPSKFLLNSTNPKLMKINETGKSLTILPGKKIGSAKPIDVVFPVLHGPYGEDGTVQGLLKLMGLPFVGASVLGSAIGMDKDVFKRLLLDAKILTAKFLIFRDFEKEKINFEKVVKTLGLPFFVKPANLGSSVGVSKVKNKKDFKEAVKEAFKYDRKILIEEFLNGREIECSVLGNDRPIASLPGEVIPTHEFYSYEAKYVNQEGAHLEIPAKLPKKVIKKIQKIAIKVFQVAGCEGMARVDFFVTKNFEIYVGEINTIPGFTQISMYPKLWELSGLSYPLLVDKLIYLALERHQKEKKLKTSVL